MLVRRLGALAPMARNDSSVLRAPCPVVWGLGPAPCPPRSTLAPPPVQEELSSPGAVSTRGHLKLSLGHTLSAMHTVSPCHTPPATDGARSLSCPQHCPAWGAGAERELDEGCWSGWWVWVPAGWPSEGTSDTDVLSQTTCGGRRAAPAPRPPPQHRGAGRPQHGLRGGFSESPGTEKVSAGVHIFWGLHDGRQGHSG